MDYYFLGTLKGANISKVNKQSNKKNKEKKNLKYKIKYYLFFIRERNQKIIKQSLKTKKKITTFFLNIKQGPNLKICKFFFEFALLYFKLIFLSSSYVKYICHIFVLFYLLHPIVPNQSLSTCKINLFSREISLKTFLTTTYISTYTFS